MLFILENKVKININHVVVKVKKVQKNKLKII